MKLRVNDLSIEYELDGPVDAPVLLMIHGVGAQLTRWPPNLCEQLIAAGFRILRYDPRDIGLSTHLDDAPVPNLADVLKAKAAGLEPDLPYTLSDLASDAAAMLDALGIQSAHVLGVSLGGMVAQTLAIEHPSRVESLAIIMSQSGNPDLPPSTPEALEALSRPAPNPRGDLAAYLDHQVDLNRILGSPAYPGSDDELRNYAALAAERAWNPSGAARQLAAGRGSADRRSQLRKLSVPTVIVHGVNDLLIPCEAGEDLAANIDQSWLAKIRGMGHDLPEELLGLFVALIRANADRTPKQSTANAN